ncbi:MAG: restriction endonuclease, partial [Candidatus Bipolaricaulia bacterium]
DPTSSPYASPGSCPGFLTWIILQRAMSQVPINDYATLVSLLAIPALVGVVLSRYGGSGGGFIASLVALTAELALLTYEVISLSAVRTVGYIALVILLVLLWNWVRHLFVVRSMDRMDPLEFQDHFCRRLLEDAGFQVLKSAGGGAGIDLIAVKDDLRYGVEIKHKDQSSGSKVSKGDVARAMEYSRLEECSRCIVITNSGFTKGAVELARHYGEKCALIDRDLIAEVLSGKKSAIPG